MSSSEDSNTALAGLCIALEETSVLLERLTDQTKAQASRLHSLSPPDDTLSLAFVQAVLKHNLAPSKISDLVTSLRDMRSEIQMCLKKLDTDFQHSWRLYTAMSSGTARRESIFSTFSTSTTLTARIKLVEWLKVREGTWGISKWRKGAITVSVVFVIWNVTHSSILVVLWNSVQIEQLTNGALGAPGTLNINEGEEQELANTALQAHLAALDTKQRRQQALLKLLNTERAYASDLKLVQSVHIPLALGLDTQLGGEIIGLGRPPSTASSTVINGTSTNTLSITSSLGSGLSISGPNGPSNPLTASTPTQALVTGATGKSNSATAERQSPSPANNELPMTQGDVRVIFGNIEQLAVFADGFAEEISTALGAEIPGGIGVDRIGELFLKRVSSEFFLRGGNN